MGNWTWDAESRPRHLPDRAAESSACRPGHCRDLDRDAGWLHPADAERAAAAVERAAETGEPYDLEYRVRRPSDGALIWVAAKGQADLRGTMERSIGMAGVVQDVTDRKHAEERQPLLIRELHHRVKNTLATVQAIVGSTARTATSIDEFYQGFVGRIVSLARTHNLLTEDLWQKASLKNSCATSSGPTRTRRAPASCVEGPHLELPSEAAVPIGMAIHELTTNAAKHGAFSHRRPVEVRWRIEPNADRRRPAMTLARTRRPSRSQSPSARASAHACCSGS